MNYYDNKKTLQDFYYHIGRQSDFEKDNVYLEEAFNDIKKIWLNNLKQIEKVNYLMIAEAPLWGKAKKYIYNPDTTNSQFFYRSDLGDILNKSITNKQDFIKTCNEIGLLVVDISPFPLNPNETSINYRDLSKSQYRQLVSLTIPTYFEKKIAAIGNKKSKDINVFFRYGRVKTNFQDIIAKVIVDNKLIRNPNEIDDISQSGGGIDKAKLRKIIRP